MASFSPIVRLFAFVTPRAMCAMGRNLHRLSGGQPEERPKYSSGQECDSGFQRAVLIRSLGADVSRDTSPLTHTYVVKCEKPKRQRNQAAEETKVTREFRIRNGGSGRFLRMVWAIMQTRLI